MKTQLNIQQIIKTAGILFAGLLLGWFFFGGTSSDQSGNIEQHVQDTHTDEQDNIVYTCSMHPNVRESEPGNCPICGMELIPLNDGGGSDAENPYELTMTPAAMKLAEIQTTKVMLGDAIKTIRMPGKVMVDERRIRSLPSHFPGRIEQLYINFTGEYIKKGEKVASVYSPALISAQKELIETLKYKEQNPSLYRAARNKLVNWKIPEQQINEIETSGEVNTQFDITSHMGGYVIKRNISVGDHVEMGTVIYQMADLSKVWVVFNAYESDLSGLGVGDEVSFNVGAYPGEYFQAEITYIDPVLDPQSRTVKVRTEATNPKGKLKPQMLAEGIISSRVAGGKQLLIPKSAVLWTGERSVVYVKKPNTEHPTFEFREVVLGTSTGEHYVVKSGVQPGEEVVTNGNFKIDSAAQLAGKASMMNREPDGKMPSGHDHAPMEVNTSEQTIPNSHTEASTDTTGHQHNDHLSILVKNYLEITNALTNDRFEVARKYLENFQTEVKQNTEMNEHSEHRQMHNQHHEAMAHTVENALTADNIEQFRTSFAAISDNLIKALENQNYNEQNLYKQYCPMANNGAGAYWISETDQISNPYTGEKMPSCGEKQKVINSGSS